MKNAISTRFGRFLVVGLVLLMLCMALPTVSAVKPAAPEIASFTHDASGSLAEGDVLTVTLVGTPALRATFDVGSAAAGQKMYETTAGTYVGTYTVDAGDDGIHTVTGHLGKAAMDADDPVVISTSGGGEEPTFSKYALVAGVNNYLYINDLLYATNDAADWAALLQGAGYQVTKLTNPSESQFRAALLNIVSKAGPEDHIAITFSGHGGTAAELGFGDKWHWLGMSDVRYGSDTGAYRDAEFAADLEGVQSTHIFLYIDSCRAQGMNEAEQDGMLAQYGSNVRGYSYDGDYTLKNGVFTWYTIYYYEQGETVMESNFAQAAPAMVSWVKSHYGLKATPVQSDKYVGDFTL